MKILGKELLMELEENERIDDLEINNLKIIQNKEWFCYQILQNKYAREAVF